MSFMNILVIHYDLWIKSGSLQQVLDSLANFSLLCDCSVLVS